MYKPIAQSHEILQVSKVEHQCVVCGGMISAGAVNVAVVLRFSRKKFKTLYRHFRCFYDNDIGALWRFNNRKAVYLEKEPSLTLTSKVHNV